MRCPTCGRTPSEPCCDKCHDTATRLEREPIWALGANSKDIVPYKRESARGGASWPQHR